MLWFSLRVFSVDGAWGWLGGALLGVGASSSVLSAVRFLVLPPAGYFPVMESNQRSPGLRARTRVGGRRWGYGACKPFGCYPPFWPPPSTLRPHSAAPRADIPLAKLVSSFVGAAGPHAAFRTAIFYLMDLGSSRCGKKPVALCFSQIGPLFHKTDSPERSKSSETPENSENSESTKGEETTPAASTPRPSCKGWYHRRAA